MNDEAPATVCPGCGRSRPQEYALCMPCQDRWDTMFPAHEFPAGWTWDAAIGWATQYECPTCRKKSPYPGCCECYPTAAEEAANCDTAGLLKIAKDRCL